ncbi:histidinol-phosphate transaminase [Paracoccaceae bacterium GXU_MW_L88]
MITPQPGILDIVPYVGGESKLDGTNKVTKLSSNENPHGPSPKAKEAYLAAAEAMAIYPSTDHTPLREAIGKVYGVDPARVICGAGSDEIISFLCNAYAGPGDEVLYAEHGFSMYPIAAKAAGATPVTASETERRLDIDAMLAAVTERTKLIFVANPNNPTGTMVALDALERLAEGLPEGVLLVIDGAYGEFVEGYDSGASLVESHPNVVMTRTFSKIYGLGGLRVGWGYASVEIIDVLNRVRGPFNVSTAALAAAEAAVLDTDYTEWCHEENARLRTYLVDGLRALGLECDDSMANFVLPRFASEEAAIAADEALRAQGIIVRRVAGYGLPEALRISVGTQMDCERVLKFLGEHLEGA